MRSSFLKRAGPWTVNVRCLRTPDLQAPRDGRIIWAVLSARAQRGIRPLMAETRNHQRAQALSIRFTTGVYDTPHLHLATAARWSSTWTSHAGRRAAAMAGCLDSTTCKSLTTRTYGAGATCC